VRDTVREALIASRPVSSVPVMPKSPLPELTHQDAPWGAPRRFEFPDRPIQEGVVLPFSEFSQALAIGAEDEPASWFATPGAETNPASQLPELSRPRTTFGTAPPGSESSKSFDNKPSSFAPCRTGHIPDTHGALSQLPAEWDHVESYTQLPELRPLGQLHESFIVAAGRDGLWIIDQHVAHERILFEQVLRQRTVGHPEIQQLLMPLVLKLTPGQEFEYARIADELNACGFETEPFGQRTIAVKAAPAGVGAGDIEKVIFEILEIAEAELRSASPGDIRRSVSATVACRAAITINTRLESSKIEWLLRALAACEYPMCCPHGRPIALRYSTKDILRSFHRI
jgi:DNA mismatch repair protein MutL